MPSLILTIFLLLPLLISSRPTPKENHDEKNQITILPNHPLERGSHVSGMSELKQYLHRFGYLPKSTANFTDIYDAEFESAITLYQSNLGLHVTGRLDSLTLTEITLPRCGVSDAITGARTVSRFAYFPGQPRWARPSPIILTYALSPTYTIDYIGRAEMEAVLHRAFERWAKVIPVSFFPAADDEAADVKLGFYFGDHGDGEPFDGVLGVLAHAFSPESGRLHLDAAETWAVDFGEERSKVAVDLESVVTHEIGHVLGLGHSSVREAVMYPSLRPRTRKVELTVDDVEGVQALYGSNPNFKFSSLLESDTSSAPSIGVRKGYSWIIQRICTGFFVVVIIVECMWLGV